MSDTLQANPFMHAGWWFWRDEAGAPHGPYNSQTSALYGLLRHIDPPWHVVLWREIKRFIGDTRG